MKLSDYTNKRTAFSTPPNYYSHEIILLFIIIIINILLGQR